MTYDEEGLGLPSRRGIHPRLDEWLTHDLDHADYLLQSCVMGEQEIDQLLALADAAVDQPSP